MFRQAPGGPAKLRGSVEGIPATGAMTLIQRFGSALNLNMHFHMLFLDGVYRPGSGPSS
jgi:hypothetical protein